METISPLILKINAEKKIIPLLFPFVCWFHRIMFSSLCVCFLFFFLFAVLISIPWGKMNIVNSREIMLCILAQLCVVIVTINPLDNVHFALIIFTPFSLTY